MSEGKCKSNFVSHCELSWMPQWNRYDDQGSKMGTSNFWPKINPAIFRPFLFPPKDHDLEQQSKMRTNKFCAIFYCMKIVAISASFLVARQGW